MIDEAETHQDGVEPVNDWFYALRNLGHGLLLVPNASLSVLIEHVADQRPGIFRRSALSAWPFLVLQAVIEVDLAPNLFHVQGGEVSRFADGPVD